MTNSFKTQHYALLKIMYIFSKFKILVFKFLWYKDMFNVKL